MQLSEQLRGAVAGALRSSGGAAEMLDILASVDSPPGNVWYVDPDTGSDGFAGLSWTEPFATMTVAVAAAEAGDTIKFRGTIAEATITVAVDNLTIRGANPAVGSSHGAGNVWMEAAAAQTELVIVTGSNCRFSNTCFRGPSAPGVTNYTKGVCIRLSGCYGTQFVGCRFQGRAGSLAAIYSATATSDDVDIIDCEFLYWNTLTYGAAILGASTGGLAYHGRNELALGMRRALDDVRIGYTLGFYAPADDPVGRFHRLTVRVKKPGVQLRYRKGYSTDNQSASLTPEDRRAQAIKVLLSPVDSTAIPIQAKAERNQSDLKLQIVLKPSSLGLVMKGDRWQGGADLVMRFAVDNGEEAGVPSSETIGFDLTQRTYEATERQGLVLTRDVRIPPEATRLRVFVLNNSNGENGTLTIPLRAIDQKCH